MKPHIVIAIQDTNYFFIQGMQHIFQAYFLTKKQSVSFVPIAYDKTADLLVVSKPKGWPIPLYFSGKNLGDEPQGTVMIWERFEGDHTPHPPSLRKLGIISSYEHPNTVVHLLQNMFDRRASPSGQENRQYKQNAVTLTPREQEILKAISAELSPYQIAKKLMINTKTVSTHKISAMRKLGFKRNSELYYWLQKRGLELDKPVLA